MAQRRANEFGVRGPPPDGSVPRCSDLGGDRRAAFAIACCPSLGLHAHDGVAAVRDRLFDAPRAELLDFERVIAGGGRSEGREPCAGKLTTLGSHWMYGSLFSEQQGFCMGLRTMTSVRVRFLS